MSGADLTATTAAEPPPAGVITTEQWKAWGDNPCTKRVLARLAEEVESFAALRDSYLSRGCTRLVASPDEAAQLGREAREMEAIRLQLEMWRQAIENAAIGQVVVGTLPMAEPAPGGPVGQNGRMAMAINPGGDTAGGCGR